jgi:hypothetical protein
MNDIHMKSTPFHLQTDLPPVPFEERHCRLAGSLKDAGLDWNPHVGCFVWDRDHHIPVVSPFPRNVYFILNLGHFQRLLGSKEDIRKKLIWLPTWHQARILCGKLGVSDHDLLQALGAGGPKPVGEDLIAVYSLILRALTERVDQSV